MRIINSQQFSFNSLSLAKKQIFLSYILKGIGVLVSFCYVPMMLSYLNQDQFGIWVAITSVVNWFRLFNFGIGGGLRFYLSSALALNNVEKAKSLISTTYFIVGVIFFLVWLIFYIINPMIDWPVFMNSQIISQSEYTRIMLYAVTCFILNFVLDIIKTIYEALGKTSVGNILQILSSLLTLVGITVLSCYAKKGQLELAVLVVTISPVIVNVVSTVITFNRKLLLLRPSIKFIELRKSKELFNLSLKFFVLQITSTVIYTSIPFVITRFYGPSSVASYHVANSIFNLPILFISLFTTPLIPFITKEYSTNNLLWVNKSLKKSMLLAFLVALFTVLLVVFSPIIYKIWLGDKISVPYQLTVIIGIYTIMNVIINPMSTFMNAIGKIDLFVKFTPLEIIFYIIGCYLFNALIGNVIAVICALILTSTIGMIIQPIILTKYLKLGKFNRILRKGKLIN